MALGEVWGILNHNPQALATKLVWGSNPQRAKSILVTWQQAFKRDRITSFAKKVICRVEVPQVLASLPRGSALVMRGKLSCKEVEQLFKLIDADGDGTLDYMELLGINLVLGLEKAGLFVVCPNGCFDGSCMGRLMAITVLRF